MASSAAPVEQDSRSDRQKEWIPMRLDVEQLSRGTDPPVRTSHADRWPRRPRGSAWYVVTILLILAPLLSACAMNEAPVQEESGPEPSGATSPLRRDIDELERIKYSPQACEANSDCPTGSHCDDDGHTCEWQCLSDT